MSLLNTHIQPFQATAFVDDDFTDISEADLLGHWSVVFFYPADFSFVCPTELADLADLYGDFQQLGTEIYAVSTDTHFCHKAWHDTSETIAKIAYPMVGDPNGALARAFDVLIEADGLAERGSFVIDPAGVIKSFEISDGSVGRSASELLRKVKAAQWVAANPGQVCPARWAFGQATLTPSAALVGKI